MKPLTPTVKENIMRDIDIDSMKMVDDKVEGLDEALGTIKSKYKGLYEDSGEEHKEEDKADPETKSEEEDLEDPEKKPVSKSVKSKSGFNFNVNSTGIKKGVSKSKPGIRFN